MKQAGEKIRIAIETLAVPALILGLLVMRAPAARAQIATESVLYSFCSQPGCTDGEDPQASLVLGSDGNFYGTTGGGASNLGTVFKITPGGTLTTLYSFCSLTNCADGYYPYAGLIEVGGNFYGTTEEGGENGAGTVFKLIPSPTTPWTLTTLYSFCTLTNCTDGGHPYAGLIQASDGNFYGTTEGFGANHGGTAFKLTPSGGLTSLYSWCSQTNCTDGEGPSSGVIEGTDGNFYGTTVLGGAGTGTVFMLTPSATTPWPLTLLHSFTNDYNGESPQAGLIQGSDGNFYGTTSGGGTNAEGGTVFKIGPSGGLTTLYSFCSQTNCADGGEPLAGLMKSAATSMAPLMGAARIATARCSNWKCRRRRPRQPRPQLLRRLKPRPLRQRAPRLPRQRRLLQPRQPRRLLPCRSS